jgi:hypothetical protein
MMTSSTFNNIKTSPIKKARVKNDENLNLAHKNRKQVKSDIKTLRQILERTKNQSAVEYLEELITTLESSL